MNNNETTIDDVLEAVNDAATKTEQNFQKEFSGIRALMVTKSYLDEKLANLKGDMIVLLRKEDSKLTALVRQLRENKGVSEDEALRLLAMEPFPDARAALL